MMFFARNQKVIARGGKPVGRTTGGFTKCRMDGCPGWRVTVKWPDGHITRPCTKGMRFAMSRKTWRIL